MKKYTLSGAMMRTEHDDGKGMNSAENEKWSEMQKQHT